jgi:hypothetical protein
MDKTTRRQPLGFVQRQPHSCKWSLGNTTPQGNLLEMHDALSDTGGMTCSTVDMCRSEELGIMRQFQMTLSRLAFQSSTTHSFMLVNWFLSALFYPLSSLVFLLISSKSRNLSPWLPYRDFEALSRSSRSEAIKGLKVCYRL